MYHSIKRLPSIHSCNLLKCIQFWALFKEFNHKIGNIEILTKTISCWTPFLFAAGDFEVPSAVVYVHNIGSEIFRLRVQGQGLVNGPCTGQLQVFKQQKREKEELVSCLFT